MHLLVVEDDTRIAALLAQGLREEGYAVDLASDGEEAVAWLDAAAFDLVVLDVILPRRDGIAVCREIRRRSLRLPVLMLTARDAVQDRVLGLDAGADDYLIKPFAFAELLARIRALLRRPPLTCPDILEVSRLRLDLGTRRAALSGTDLPLTRLEFSLLELLARNAGRVLPRDLIADHLWNLDGVPDTNSVEVHIYNIRRKLRAAGDGGLLRTVRGVGYQLAPT